MVQCFFEAGILADKYQRNNKDSGQKNLRCFPSCDYRGHVRYGFCGQAVEMRVINLDKSDQLFAWAEFCLNDSDSNVKVGDVLDKKEIVEKLERTRKFPSRDWIKGELCDKNSHFKFNKARLGWHYSWVSNVHTCDSLHVLRAYVFMEIPGQPGKLRCIQVVNSTPFRIYCSRRRQRKNAAAAAAALAASLGSDNESNSSNKTLPQPINTDYFGKSNQTACGFNISTPTYQNVRNAEESMANFSPKKRKFNAIDVGVNLANLSGLDLHQHPSYLKKYKSEPASPVTNTTASQIKSTLEQLQSLLNMTQSPMHQQHGASMSNASSISPTQDTLQSLLQMAMSPAGSHSSLLPNTTLPAFQQPSQQQQLNRPVSPSSMEIQALLNQHALISKLLNNHSSSGNAMASTRSTPNHSPPQSPLSGIFDSTDKHSSDNNATTVLGYHF